MQSNKPVFIKLATEDGDKILINISSTRYKKILENKPRYIKLTTADGETKVLNVLEIRFVGESAFENSDPRYIALSDRQIYVKETIDEIEKLINNAEICF